MKWLRSLVSWCLNVKFRPGVWLRWFVHDRRRFIGSILVVLAVLILLGKSRNHPVKHNPALAVAAVPTTTIPEAPLLGLAPTTTSTTAAPTSPSVAPTTTAVASGMPEPAVATALAFVANWAHPEADLVAWRGTLAPLVTPELAKGLAVAIPANVPAHRVIGLPTALGDAGGGQVLVPTDIGPVVVIVVPSGTDWLISSIEPVKH